MFKRIIIIFIGLFVSIQVIYNLLGFCIFDLQFHHKKRLDNALEHIADSIIVENKSARRKLYTEQGYTSKNVDDILSKLEPKYQRERKKLFKYCRSFQSYFLNFKNFKSSQCTVSQLGGSWEFGGVLLSIKYTFDKESHIFFNEYSYEIDDSKDNVGCITIDYQGIIYRFPYSSNCLNKRRYEINAEYGDETFYPKTIYSSKVHKCNKKKYTVFFNKLNSKGE